MKALLLAAGLGSRLKPLTDTIPKCLVPIDGKPLLEYWLAFLTHNNINDIYINLHYHAQSVRDYIEQSPFKDKVTLIEETELLGTGGTLKNNADFLTDDTFFLAHADNLCLTDFGAFIQAHHNRPPQTALTMMTFTPEDPRTCGVVELNNQNIVTAFHEKVENPPTTLANGAVFIMEPEIAQFAKDHDKDHFEISLDIIPAFKGRILAWHNHHYHLDIGIPATYQQAQNDTQHIRELYQQFGETIT